MADLADLIAQKAALEKQIADARRFYQSAFTEQGGADRLEVFTEAAMRRALGAASSNDIISGRRAELMQAIENDLNRSAATELGVRVIDRPAEYASDEASTESVMRHFMSQVPFDTLVTIQATSPLLEGKGGVYLENCEVAEPASKDNPMGGVFPHVRDEDLAERLWAKSEEMTGVSFRP